MIDSHGAFLLGSAFAAVLALILLIAWAKLNPFVTIVIVSLALAIWTGMTLQASIQSFESGLGAILGHIAVIVGLGTMLGKMLAESGAADRIAQSIIGLFGERWAPWSMLLAAVLIGLPVFFEVAFVLMAPIAFTVARRTGKSPLLIGLPMVAGLSMVHGLIPPHPAALIAVVLYKANIGQTIFYALLCGLPAAAVGGPIYGRWIAPRIHLNPHNPIAEQFIDHHPERGLPGFGVSFATLSLPIALMLMGGWASAWANQGGRAARTMLFLGNADIALLLAVLLSFFTLGKMRGFNRNTVLRFSNECLAPTAMVTLLVGAGGGFGRVLQDSGVSQAIVTLALHTHLSFLFLAWSIAALIRLATGSATVAMTTAAGIMAPAAIHMGSLHAALLAIATGAGSLIFSHVNDGGFWLVKEFFNMTVPQTLKTWSVCETAISVTGLLLVLALAALTSS